MKSSFTPAVEDVVGEESSTPAPVPSTAVAVPRSLAPAPADDSFFRNENMEGDFDRSDLQIPGLNLVHSVGPLSEHFTPGQMVYNKEEVLGTPVEITLLRLKKYFQEKLPYGSEVLPRRYNTQDAARADGLLPGWEKVEGVGVFEPVLEAQVLIGDEKKNRPTWPLEFGDKAYAIARFTLKSMAFSQTGKMFISSSQFGLRGGLHTGFWHITPKREKVGVNMVWLPKAKLAGKHTAEFIAWVADKI